MFQRTDSLQRTMRPQPAVSRSGLAKRAFRFLFSRLPLSPQNSLGATHAIRLRHRRRSRRLHLRCSTSVRMGGRFSTSGRSPCDGASKEATCANQVKRREQQLEPRAQETLLIDIALRRESQTAREVCHQMRRERRVLKDLCVVCTARRRATVSSSHVDSSKPYRPIAR